MYDERSPSAFCIAHDPLLDCLRVLALSRRGSPARISLASVVVRSLPNVNDLTGLQNFERGSGLRR